MLKSLQTRLILAFVLVSLVSTALIMTYLRLTNTDRFTNFIAAQILANAKADLVSYYTTNGSWDGIEGYLQQQRVPAPPPQSQPQPTPPSSNSVQPPPPPGTPSGAPRNIDRRSMFGLADAQGVVVIQNSREFPVGSTVPQEILASGTAIEVNGKRVGTLLSIDRKPTFTPEESLFIEKSNQALLLGTLGAVLLAMIVGFFLARALIRPLTALTVATQKIAAGSLEQQVYVRSNDEIGQLARSFNQMSAAVAHANHLRRQMTADIAHDLRTPLTVIAGYIESMRDGVLQPTPERFDLIYNEIELLEKLIEDLRLLSQADAGKLTITPQWLSPQYLLERAGASHQHLAGQKKVTLAVEAPDTLPEIWVDEARMMQVFDNLISNAMRYTPEGGKITLSAVQSNGGVTLAVSDTGTGIPKDELSHIFERFYRVDPSRSSSQGESGLGLAIVRALVEAQGGKVTAESEPGCGTTITISMSSAEAGKKTP